MVENWQSRLHAASFRGVAFGYLDHRAEGGRRIALHEYPFKDDPYPEDMGQSAGSMQISAFLIGPDHDLLADSLETALNKNGPGKLVHPRYGEVQVQLEAFSRSETSTEGGITKFDLTFIRYVAITTPTETRNAQADVLALVNNLSGNLSTLVQKRITDVSQTDNTWLAEQAKTILNTIPSGSSAADALQPIVGNARNYPATHTGLFTLHADIIDALSVLPDSPNDATSGGWLSQSNKVDSEALRAQQDELVQVAGTLLNE